MGEPADGQHSDATCICWRYCLRALASIQWLHFQTSTDMYWWRGAAAAPV